MSKKPIGGYFGWEFPETYNHFPHEEGRLFSNARSAIKAILTAIPKATKVYLPYFTCDVVLNSMYDISLPYERYHIDENFHIIDAPSLKENEYIIYTNYYGVQDSYCKELATVYGNQLIVDNAQAWFAPHIAGTHSVFSIRKFVGVPDGGIGISDRITDEQMTEYCQVEAYNRCAALLARADEDVPTGYDQFQVLDHQWLSLDVQRISSLSKKILHTLDYKHILEKRRANYSILEKALGEKNQFKSPPINTFACPLVYPFLTSDGRLRQHLIEHQIFVARYWPNVLQETGPSNLEYHLASNIMALPIDQRYNEEDMKSIIETINNYTI